MPSDIRELTTPALEDELATLAAHLHAATARLLGLVAELDRREAWAQSGALSCAHWLAWRIGLDLGAAREHVRVARALAGLPAIGRAFGRGELSYSKVRAVTRIARPETEADLLAMARAGTAAQLERLVRAYRRADPAAERAQAAAQAEARWLHTRWAEDGTLVVEGRLTPEQGTLLQRALEVAMEEQLGEAEPLPSVAQRRADALALVADRALGNGATRTGGDRVQVVVHVDAEVLADPTVDGRSELEDGPGVPAEVSRRLACDCSREVLRYGAGGEVVAGRKSRVIAAPLRRALRARDDGHCVWPGCTNRRCDGHHLEHWADGGPTTLDNLALVCDRHHTLLHEGGWRMERAADGTVRVVRRDGTAFPTTPPPPPLGRQPVADLYAAQAGAGITAATGTAAWDDSPVDYEWGARALHRQLAVAQP